MPTVTPNAVQQKDGIVMQPVTCAMANTRVAQTTSDKISTVTRLKHYIIWLRTLASSQLNNDY